ncbi:MAG: FHA domain-containing protein [Lentisphaerae bacterium]|nr:FHA domain-containing protein [Lentisphaerota bacterium]
MILRYGLPDGKEKEVKLSQKAITIGRGADADLQITDKLASRLHCGISYWDEAYFIRDFNSRNGTLVNGQPIKVSRLKPGDRIQVGDTILSVTAGPSKGPATVMRELKDEMAKGKGYHTIMREIIRDEEKTGNT